MITEQERLGAKIFIVDDRPDNTRLLEKMLQRAGYTQIRSITDSRQAVENYIEYQPDLVLLDLKMPHLDGFQVMKKLQSLEENSYAPILVLTAQSEGKNRLRALKSGAKDFLGKPFDHTEALARISNMLEVRLLDKKVREQNRTLEQKIQERTAELHRTNEELKDFVSIAAHDLQEPLRKILIFGNLIMEKYSSLLDPSGMNYIFRLEKSTQRMKKLLSDLLEFSEIISRVPVFELIDLKQIVAEALSHLEVQREQTQGQVEIGDFPQIHADKLQMRLLFQNLISNALKFQSKGSSPSVKITCQYIEVGWLNILVEDNGIGFDEKYLERIFKPFERLHAQNEYEGTGVGLAICQKIVKSHGGQITAKSSPQTGTTFFIKLPNPLSDHIENHIT